VGRSAWVTCHYAISVIRVSSGIPRLSDWLEGFGVKLLVAGVRWSFPRKDAGSPRTRSGTGATEDAVEGASSAALRHSGFCAKPSY